MERFKDIPRVRPTEEDVHAIVDAAYNADIEKDELNIFLVDTHLTDEKYPPVSGSNASLIDDSRVWFVRLSVYSSFDASHIVCTLAQERRRNFKEKGGTGKVN